MPDSEAKKKKKAKKEEKPDESPDEVQENDEDEDRAVPKEEKKKKKSSKKSKSSSSSGWLDGTFANIFFFALAGGIGYCRYYGIKVPVLDDFILQLRGESFGGGAGGSAADASWSLDAVRAGKAMAVNDLMPQMSRYCGRWGKCSAEYWEELPNVAAVLKSGPGTWDRKPLKKAEAKDIDGIIAKVAGRPEARQKANWDALRAISKELFDVTPKSMKESLACRAALKSPTPPAGPTTTAEVPEDDVVVDDLP